MFLTPLNESVADKDSVTSVLYQPDVCGDEGKVVMVVIGDVMST